MTAEPVDQVVKVGLSELVDRDLESFLDLLDELTAPTDDEADLGLLSETDYMLVGVGDEPNTIMLRVTGLRESTPHQFDGDPRG